MSWEDIATKNAKVEEAAGKAATLFDLYQAVLVALERKADEEAHAALLWEFRIFGLYFDRSEATSLGTPTKVKQLSIERVFPNYEHVKAELPADVDSYLSVRIDKCTCASAESRFADFLWLRTKKFEFARRAISAYVRAAKAVVARGSGGLAASAELLNRARYLVRSLRQDSAAFAVDVFEVIQMLEKRTAVIWLANVAKNCADELVAFPEEASGLLQRLVAIAKSVATVGGDQRRIERELLESAAVLAHKLGESTRADELRAMVPDSLQREAEERGTAAPLLKMVLLKEGLERAAELGLSAKVSELKTAVLSATAEANKSLKTSEVSVTISGAEIINEVMEAVNQAKAISPTAHLLFLALDPVMWPAWEEVQAAVRARQSKYPLSGLVNVTLIGPDGHPISAPENGAERAKFDEIREFCQRMMLALEIFRVKLHHLRQTGDWNAQLLLRVMADGLLFEGDALTRVAPGVIAFEEGRYWEAVHVLVPQVERILRTAGLKLGSDVGAFEKETRRVRWTTLGEVLSKEQVRQFFNQLGSSFSDELSYVLDHPYGLNLRNQVAHGILPPDGNVEHYALLMVLVLLGFSNFIRKDVPEHS